jgi:hypothetical protein
MTALLPTWMPMLKMSTTLKEAAIGERGSSGDHGGKGLGGRLVGEEEEFK